MEDEARLKAPREKLLAVRAKRVRPGLDDKVLADWNGLMIAALANAGTLMSEPHWIEMASRAFRFVSESMSKGNRLGHSWRAGRLLFPGLSSDFAAMTRAAIALHQATGKQIYLDRAAAWTVALEKHHADPETGGYFLTADDAEGLIIRPALTRDDALPNPNALIAQNLVRLALLAGDDQCRERADRLLEGLLPFASQSLFNHMVLFSALDLRTRHIEIVAVGKQTDAFATAALKLPFFNRTFLRAENPTALSKTHPARAKAESVPETGAVFVCQSERCSLPIADPTKIADAIVVAHV